MPMDPSLFRSFAANVDWVYAGLVRQAKSSYCSDAENRLGGNLIYAGELEGAGSVVVVAANIAGAASLTATADIGAQRQAARDGVIQFLATTLSEALSILKIEIRKCNAAAVCVTLPPDLVLSEMAHLEVFPDLLPPGSLDASRFEAFLKHGARLIDPVSAGEDETVLTWSVDREPGLWLTLMDDIALDCLGSNKALETWAARRWIRNAPHYLGRMEQGMRLLRCKTKVANEFLDRVRERVVDGRLDAVVQICSSGVGEPVYHTLSPPSDSHRSKVSVSSSTGKVN